MNRREFKSWGTGFLMGFFPVFKSVKATTPFEEVKINVDSMSCFSYDNSLSVVLTLSSEQDNDWTDKIPEIVLEVTVRQDKLEKLVRNLTFTNNSKGVRQGADNRILMVVCKPNDEFKEMIERMKPAPSAITSVTIKIGSMTSPQVPETLLPVNISKITPC